MFERLMSALTIGLPLGVLSALVLAPLARGLSERLMAQYAATEAPSTSLRSRHLNIKIYLDLLLVGSLCVCQVLVVMNWGVSWHAGMAAIYCATLQVLARIDAQIHLLPDLLTLPLLWAGLLFHWSGGWVPLEDAVAGAAAGYGVLWLIWAVFRGCSGRDGIGFGDLKLAAANGAWLGVEALPWALLVASLTACVAALLRRATGRLKRFEAVAFGPYLAMGSILVLFCTQNSLSFLSSRSLTSLLVR
jgi:prepilin signal peptidase PulO-like enzyme (type II secretory pathway)